jgi:hypothetical protein
VAAQRERSTREAQPRAEEEYAVFLCAEMPAVLPLAGEWVGSLSLEIAAISLTARIPQEAANS